MVNRKRQRPQDDQKEADTMAKMASVKRSAVPSYLHTSEFYLSLQDDEDSILVPSDCLKMDDTISNTDELRMLLLTLRFWVAPGIANTVYAYALSHPFESYESVLSEFYNDFPSLEIIEPVVTAPPKKQMCRAVAKGVIELAEYLVSQGHFWPEQASVRIAESGDLEALKRAHAAGCSLKSEACMVAARIGSLECLKFLHENGCPWDEETCAAAVQGNHLDCLMYAHENGCAWHADADDPELNDIDLSFQSLNLCTYAAFHNRIDCLRYVHQQGVPMVRELYYGAVRKNAIECIKYAYEQGLPLYSKLHCAAAQFDRLELLQFLHERNVPWNDEVPCIAAAFGNLECLEYIMEHGGIWDVEICRFAVESAEIDIVIYALRNGCPPSSNLFRIEDESEFMRVLEVFVELNLPWEAVPEAPLCAIMQSFLPGLKFMIEHGCPWHARCAELIACIGRVDLLQTFHENGCPLFTDDTDRHAVCASAIQNNSIGCLEYGFAHGSTIPADACDELMKNRRYHLECFKYAHKHGGCKLFKNYIEQAARDGQLQLLTYLHEQGCKWDAKAAVAAAKNGHEDCLEYVLRNGCARSKDICISAAKRGNEKCLAIAKKYGCV